MKTKSGTSIMKAVVAAMVVASTVFGRIGLYRGV